LGIADCLSKQVVWKGSQRVGCGFKICPTLQAGTSTWTNANLFVCRYHPKGNFIGQFPTNVLAP
jgi:hypothetical protein